MRLRLLLTAAALTVGAADATAQTSALEALGIRVRVTTTDSRRVVGVLTAVTADDVTLIVADRRSMTLPVSAVTRLDMSHGRHGHSGRGGLIGLAIGGAGAGIATFAACRANPCNGYDGIAVAGATVGGGLVGFGLGSAVGALIVTERWESVTLPGPQGSAGPPGRIGVGLRLPLRRF